MVLENVEKSVVVNAKKTNLKTRDCMVDVIRIMACLMVIAVHSNSFSITNLDKTRIFWGLMFGDGVTIFLIIMGFFLFRNKSFKKLLIKTFTGICLPAFCFAIFADFFLPFFLHDSSLLECLINLKSNIYNIFKAIINWTVIPNSKGGHLWYIYKYFRIIIMYPILKAITDNEKANKYFIIVTFFIVLYDDMIGFFKFKNKINTFYFINQSVLYPLIGYEIYKRKNIIKNNRKITLISIIILFVVEIVRYIMQYKLFEININDNRFVWWTSSFACICSAAFIIFVMSFEINNEKISKIISYIGQRTFFIYLIHTIIISNYSFKFELFVIDKLGYKFETICFMNIFQEAVCIFLKVIYVFFISLIISIIFHQIKILLSKGLKMLKEYNVKVKKII